MIFTNSIAVFQKLWKAINNHYPSKYDTEITKKICTFDIFYVTVPAYSQCKCICCICKKPAALDPPEPYPRYCLLGNEKKVRCQMGKINMQQYTIAVQVMVALIDIGL